jgi:hypothetical protein
MREWQFVRQIGYHFIKATSRRIIEGKAITHVIKLFLVDFACSCN